MRRIIGLALVVGLLASCEFDPVSPTVSNADIEIFNQAVTLVDGGVLLKWEGALLNRSEFNVSVGVQVEFKNPDDVVFYVTSEELVPVGPQATNTFLVEIDPNELQTLVFTSIKTWEMKTRLINWTTPR